MQIETSDSKKPKKILALALFALLIISAVIAFGSLMGQNLRNVRFGHQLFTVHPSSESISCQPSSVSDTDSSITQAALSTDDPLLYGPRIAQYYQRQGQQDRADEWWTELADCRRCLATVWYERGLAANAAGDNDTALNVFKQAAAFPIEACDTIGSSDALYHFASLTTSLQEDEWISNALYAFQEAVARQDFTDYEAYIDSRYQVGRLLFLQRHDSEAAPILLDLLDERPAHTWANLLLGRLYARSDDKRELARKYLTEAVESGNDVVWRPMYYLSLYELDSGNPQTAFDWLEQARDRNPDDSRILDALNKARDGTGP